MKKILLLAISFLFIVPVNAATYNPANQVQTIGEKLLSSNGVRLSDVKFTVVSDSPNNSDFIKTRVVNISSAELSYAGNDNETAAVVANELGHIISGHASRGKVVSLLQAASNTKLQTTETAQAVFTNYKNTKEDMEADIVAVNMMVKAGYNPLAMIVVLTKQTGTYWQVLKGEPANADKAMNIYNYMSYAYPSELKKGYGCNEYKTFLTYAQMKDEQRAENKKLQAKYEKTYKKAKKTSTAQLTKFIQRGGLSGWDAVYELLNTKNN